MISRTSIDTLKNVFREQVEKADWQLIVKLKGDLYVILLVTGLIRSCIAQLDIV